MAGKAETPAPTAKRAAQHIRLSRIDGAYEHLCVLPLLSSLAPSTSMLVDAPLPHGSGANLAGCGVHCWRASDGLLPPRPYLVGYARLGHAV